MSNFWVEKAKSVLLNRTIVSVRYMNDEEVNNLGFYYKALVILLDDGTLIYPSKDDEGNDAGALHYIKPNDDNHILPVIS